ncbi:hypothetical protein RC1_1396 [Rhodospirillum centenum SW]|uniref:Uncharacterized protein n=1 Tax=Rhodospirillum centenum (strain ATCC 51521 / SW) TaxID=414684 RepID=B6IT42_RHOCS|nr:hypothetical protein RC1_1396 [Rhodospirillum centenum SW]
MRRQFLPGRLRKALTGGRNMVRVARARDGPEAGRQDPRSP